MINRDINEQILRSLNRGKSILLLGPRQTGKTTLIKSIKHDRYINLMDNRVRQRYEAQPSLLTQEITALQSSLQRKPLVMIDEIQKIPNITDNIQVLIDEKIAKFIISGSSARKIKNLLPGRVIKFELFPLSIYEMKDLECDLDKLLLHGSLPGIVNIENDLEREQELISYVSLYLEEEIRKEALVRNLGAFNNFLRLAAIESGNIVNFSKMSQAIGVAHSTIAEYYKILVDCMIAKKIEPLIEHNSRRKLNKSPKYIFFDLGLRRIAAGESSTPHAKQLPLLFEQFVGLELQKFIVQHQYQKHFLLLFWRDHAGPEIDFVLKHQGDYIPIEVKSHAAPNIKDAKHLMKFMDEYQVQGKGYIICQTPYSFEITENIIAISWQDLEMIF